eukprot:5836593-Pyramimonas_sp.AAC.1
MISVTSSAVGLPTSSAFFHVKERGKGYASCTSNSRTLKAGDSIAPCEQHHEKSRSPTSAAVGADRQPGRCSSRCVAVDGQAAPSCSSTTTTKRVHKLAMLIEFISSRRYGHRALNRPFCCLLWES